MAHSYGHAPGLNPGSHDLHRPWGDFLGLSRGMGFKQPLLEAWKPFLDRRGSREDALAALLAQAAAGSK